MAGDPKNLGETLADLMKAAEPAFRQAAKRVEEAGRIGNERYRQGRSELRNEWDDFDKELDQRWRGRK